jgi:hypothetical protein
MPLAVSRLVTRTATLRGMYVVGARFGTLAAANAALQDLRSAVPVAPGDVAAWPLGSTRYDEPADAVLLAGRFAEEAVPVVLDVLESHGGEVIERRRDDPRSHAVRSASRRTSIASNPPWSAPWSPSTQHARTAARPPSRHRKRLRRPVARLHVRAARAHRDR